jgi:hypothetical protein
MEAEQLSINYRALWMYFPPVIQGGNKWFAVKFPVKFGWQTDLYGITPSRFEVHRYNVRNLPLVK